MYKRLVFEVQPPCSPDLSPLYVYLWGNLIILEYSLPIGNEDTLHPQVRNCPGIFDRVWHSMISCVHLCIDSGGGHFEVLFLIAVC